MARVVHRVPVVESFEKAFFPHGGTLAHSAVSTQTGIASEEFDDNLTRIAFPESSGAVESQQRLDFFSLCRSRLE